MVRELPDLDYLHLRLRYEPESGTLFWRYYEPHGPQWNGKHAGRKAFAMVDSRGYLYGSVDGQKHRAHRVIWAMHHGTWPEGEIDHEDHDRTHNQIGNLRVTDRTGNNINSSQHKRNTSGVTGVYWDKRAGRWLAQLTVRGQQYYLGRFDTVAEAAAARKRAEIKHGFHPNHGLPK